MILIVLATGVGLWAVEVSVPIIPAKVQQRYPWNGLVDIQLTNVMVDAKVILSAKDMTTGQSLTVETLTLAGELFTNGVSVVTNESVHLVWDAMTDVGGNAVIANARFFAAQKFDALYMVVDLSDGTSVTTYPVSYLMSAPSSGWTDEYKTTKLVMRWIEPGTFREANIRDVTLTKGYWMGVFEMTQRQYALVMGPGSNPSQLKGDMYPMMFISYNTIRDSSSWPNDNTVGTSSVLGKLRAKTGRVFDLPTEAQWEYACRAGTTWDNSDVMGWYGWYADNSDYTVHDVGLKLANPWGLYDMHGNVWEWCLDWTGSLGSSAAMDPRGSASGSHRVLRGGGWCSSASSCRSTTRSGDYPSYGGNGFDFYGFRLVCSVGQD